MTASAVRWVVLVVCIAGIAGMIVMSVRGSTGGALTFGIVTTAAVLCMIVATAVANAKQATAASATAHAEEVAADLEEAVVALIADGAEETKVRSLVADAIRYGRGTR